MACSLPRLFSFSFALSRVVYVGRQEWRQEAASSSPLPPSSLPFLPSSFSSLTHLKLFTHSVTHSSAPVAPPSTKLFLPSNPTAPSPLAGNKKRKKEKRRFPVPTNPRNPFFCLSVSIARGGCPPAHHNSLGAEVRRGVLRCE